MSADGQVGEEKSGSPRKPVWLENDSSLKQQKALVQVQPISTTAPCRRGQEVS